MIKGIAKTGKVYLDEYEIYPSESQKVFNHSPDGFSWGYAGSGPAQLALALLLKYGMSEYEAVRHHQNFKFDIIAKFPQGEDFELESDKVVEWIQKNVRESKRGIF